MFALAQGMTSTRRAIACTCSLLDLRRVKAIKLRSVERDISANNYRAQKGYILDHRGAPWYTRIQYAYLYIDDDKVVYALLCALDPQQRQREFGGGYE